MKASWATALTVAAIAALVIGPLVLTRSSASEYQGVDALAVEEAQRIDPDHEPWFTPVWSPPGTETESLLFALQAALGAGVIGYIAGSLRTRSRQLGTPADGPGPDRRADAPAEG
ncbi:MAG: energy-coupling factor ABC transporter substrate-binding protein [Actinomycetota bacterium]